MARSDDMGTWLSLMYSIFSCALVRFPGFDDVCFVFEIVLVSWPIRGCVASFGKGITLGEIAVEDSFEVLLVLLCFVPLRVDLATCGKV